MKKIIIIFTLLFASLKSYSVGIDATYNVSIFSLANTQISVRDIAYGFGFYVNVKGLSNGVKLDNPADIYKKYTELLPVSDKVDISNKDGEVFRSGSTFGITKQIFKYFFIGFGVGYCDETNYQRTVLTSYVRIENFDVKTGEFSYNNHNGVSRKLDVEVMFGTNFYYEKFYIPLYFGWSNNYTGYFGIGIGKKF